MRTPSLPAERAWRRALETALAVRREHCFRRPIAFAIHLAIASAAYTCAFALRFDFALPVADITIIWATLPLLLVIRLAVLWLAGVYRGSWRHVGMSDLAALAFAATVSTMVFVTALYAFSAPVVPRSVLVLDWMLFIFFAGGVRFAVRYGRSRPLPGRGAQGRRTLIIGAGEGAERFLRQSLQNPHGKYLFVGLLDDKTSTYGLSLHGIPVLGSIDRVSAIAQRQRAELLVIAIPSAAGEQVRRIVELCTSTGLEFKILPPLDELLDGRAQVGQLRDVRIEDLLGRDPIHLDLERVQRDLQWKTALVTGGAGSIGSELARQIAGFCPERLILFEQAESPLYFVQLELARLHPDVEIIPVIGDITDPARLESVFEMYRPDYVFHAAAYKHVPMMEANVVEAVRNNVVGTLRVAECAARHGAEKFVLISTDKAVNPSSVMGVTKRLAELIVLGCPGLRASKTDFRAVRFGNVLGSDGSVIPLFKRQIAAGGPLTVTHADVRRYFMSIPEAVQLVLQAAALPEARNRISMLDMGEPVRILDLAEQLIRLSGLIPYRDVQIVFTGLRPGEKLHEELMTLVEASIPTAVEKIRIVETGALAGWELEAGMQRLRAALESGDPAELVAELHALVPEYTPRRDEAERPITTHAEPERQRVGERGRGVSMPRHTQFDVGVRVGPREQRTIALVDTGRSSREMSQMS
jgi:FlaA1/EpsC-like NDP-sugar epimerase